MDLLIHAIIWLFKALFGDSEEQARVGPRRDSDPNSGGYRRGPYDYGDGRSSGTGGTKTLAELLEEARRQSGAAPSRPAAQQPPPPARVAPPAQAGSSPQGTRSLADLLDEARRQGRAPQAPAQPPVQRAPVAPTPPRPAAPVAPVAPTAPAYSVPPPPQPQPSKKKKRKRRDETRPAPAPTAAAQAGMHGMRSMQGTEGMRGMRTMQGAEGMHGMRATLGVRSAKTHRGMHVSAEGREVGRFVAELRSATGDEKRMAGARAVAMLEVFGAPRCRRPHRPGARLF